MALSRNPFAKPAAKASDALAKTRAAGAAKLAKAEDAAKRQLAKVRAGSYALATKAKEPIMSVAYNEGIRLAGHTGAFVADYMIQARGSQTPGVLRTLVRPSTGVAALSFGAAAFTRGETRLHAREVGQGALHALWAVVLRNVTNAISPGYADRAMGEAGDAGAADY